MAKDNAIGLIETRGIVALVAGIEAMMKTSEVQTVNVERIGSGYFSAAVQGDIAAVRQALDSGSAAVKQYGELRSAQLYPRPAEESVALLDNGTRDLLGGGTPKKG
ncbi:BMC domain-containing protein [Nocardioides soli]|uniref:Ethanolamine utilization protein EutM n=1 Tax=Nocardioides soli TaxID=1036020 RepID=A0A7W4Z200_9ACTN|nr:BMC domain-containing protein [Nocardioides soli]MBB3042391.1 ethanolamine utilization protein EutM [Nocardioides soli]